MLSMPGGAVLLARVPAHGLEGTQAGVHGGTAMSVGESEAVRLCTSADAKPELREHYKLQDPPDLRIMGPTHARLQRYRMGPV